MRCLIQRVRSAQVDIDQITVGQISEGLLLLLGIETEDQAEDVEWLVSKILRLRIFEDAAGLMNLSIQDISGQLLVVSQFTLHASTRKGNRPSFIRAARPDHAIPLYESFLSHLAEESGLVIQSGRFGANMQVQLINDGPVTIWLDSKNRE